MKTRIILVTALAVVLLAPVGAQAQRLQLDSLDRLKPMASESVNIDLDPGLLKFALGFLKGPDDADAKQMLSELKGIYVRSFEFTSAVDSARDLDPIRKQLATGSWVRLVGVDSKREGGMVEIYSWRQGDTSGGLAIVAAEPNEVTVVNIVGAFDLSRLGALKGLGVPDIK